MPEMLAVFDGVGVGLAVGLGEGDGVGTGVGVGVALIAAAGPWIATVIGEPVLKNPTEAVTPCGG